ncbi:cysteine hydrolase family protein [Peribacillus sp. SCS-26]|uniref:cysteine hydrolase family protein n=1 Tax=Paraperibacillus marinus TaxID=3115295 RepID=UPI00390660FE
MSKEALIIVDMSNDFVSDTGTLTAGRPAQEIVPYIKDQADRFFSEGKLVVFTMDAHEENDPHFQLWPPHNIKGTKGQELFGDLKEWYKQHKENENRVWYIPKTNYNAFHETGLAEKLKEQGVEKVHVTGVCTDICSYQTVAGADAAGFKTAIHKRGNATFTDLGDTFIEHMKLCFHTEIIV